MIKLGVSELQKRPSILKSDEIIELVDKRDEKRIGIFIPQKYSALFEEILDTIERQRRKKILRTIKKLDDMGEWDEVAGDGL